MHVRARMRIRVNASINVNSSACCDNIHKSTEWAVTDESAYVGSQRSVDRGGG